MTRRPALDPDMARILASIAACEDFAEPHQLLETHDLSDVLTAFSGGLIRCVRRHLDGKEGFALTPKGEQAAHGSGPPRLKVENDIEALRRDMQQLTTALQEVARKVARHEQMATTTIAFVHAAEDIDAGTHARQARGAKC